jgi:hypothetical protein
LGDRYGIDFMALSDRNALTAAMIAEMHASGLVEFGGHSAHHAYLSLSRTAPHIRRSNKASAIAKLSLVWRSGTSPTPMATADLPGHAKQRFAANWASTPQ